MHCYRAKAVLLLLAGAVTLGLLALAWVIGAGSSEADNDAMHNCPQPGKWAISVWSGQDGTDTGQALATCGEGAVDFAYYIDPNTQAWLRYFVGRPEINNLLTLDHMQGVIAHGTVGVPPASPTPTPTPSAAGGVEVLNYRSHKSEYGSLCFYGEVESREGADVAAVEVVLTLFDGADKVVGTGEGYVEPSCLSPGERGAFSIYVLDPPDTWARETLQVEWSPMSEWYREMCYEAFSVSGVSVMPGEYGGLTVRGQVTNTGAESATLIEVVFVGYDAAGEVLVVDSTFADVDPLAPGQSSPFEMWVTELDASPPSYRMIVQAWAD